MQIRTISPIFKLPKGRHMLHRFTFATPQYSHSLAATFFKCSVTYLPNYKLAFRVITVKGMICEKKKKKKKVHGYMKENSSLKKQQ